ncbi:helix-turn-helix domain-containing protein [Tychonema sp. LEGE 07203]|uniref:helix-turn-helix domain-containing protein n=1 Tax=Tychonema sp. LEGE 07203 TaxID=1828671 RepID=UPI00187E3347|nr:helix-turn-helix domain-containing protein [Tychonema sp. LEGE 07203]MBE9095714.1 helix-turn-helix domain-containing protein [Tychonema sp. LEGE 07203]
MYFFKARDSLRSRICRFINLDDFFVAANIPDCAPQLQRLMQQAGFSSDRELSQKAGVPEIQLSRLRRGLALKTRADILLKISQALQISLTELLATLAPDFVEELEPAAPSALEQEYQRLQATVEQQRESLMQEFQLSSLQILESWMLQWPTAASKAQENHNLRAQKLLPLLRPVEQLLQHWGVESIAPVGAELPYNPQQHQLMEGTAEPGEPVKVRYTGYRQGDKLLYRAKVSLVRSIA